MIYSREYFLDYVIKEKIIRNLYRRNDFTLTVNAVNDAPVLLQSFEDLEIEEDSGGCSSGAQYHII